MAEGGTASVGRIVLGVLIAGGVVWGASLLLNDPDREAARVALGDAPAPEAPTRPAPADAGTAPEAPAPAAPAPDGAAPEAPETPNPAEPAEIATAPADENAAVPEPEAEVETAALGPRFDTFRVDGDGQIVLAGQAAPGQTIAVLLGGTEIDRVTADDSGAFVSLPFAGYSDQPRKLVLVADPDGAAEASRTSYIVAPIVEPLDQVAEADPSVIEGDPAGAPVPQEGDPLDTPATEIAGLETVEPAPLVVAEAPDAPEAATPGAAPDLPAAPSANPATPEDEEEPLPEPPSTLAPTVLQADAEGISVLQTAPAAPEVSDSVALEAITYAPTGDVQISGRASGDGSVQVYLDNTPVTSSQVEAGGDWRVDLPDVDTGVYTLRIDEVDSAGEVVSRVETPFKREEASDVAALMAEETAQEDFEVAVRTVQPGSTLWAIAEEALGDGIFYVQVFELNRDLIKNPDLIYPGQIFRLPEAESEAESAAE